MKSNAFHISIITVLLAIFCSSFGQQKSDWKGEIGNEDGVKIVNNPEKPLYGEITLDLEEDLSIGKTDDENYLFYKVKGIAVDKHGNIFVVDAGNHRVQKFDVNGNFLLSIGKKGQGPGEFSNPYNVRIDDETGNVMVNDSIRKILVFDKDGKYLNEDICFDEILKDFYIDAEKNILGKYGSARDRGLVKIADGGKVNQKITEIPFRINIQRLSSRREGSRLIGQFIGVIHGYEFDIFLSPIDKQMFVYGYSKEYKLNVINIEGKCFFIIRKDAQAKNFTKAIKDRIFYRARTKALQRGQTIPNDYSFAFPEYMPFFYSILTDSEGRIYIQTNTAELEPTQLRPYDIFSRDGYYMYKTFLEIRPDVIKRGFLYTRTQDEDTGDEIVQRYKIKNWNQIKTGIN